MRSHLLLGYPMRLAELFQPLKKFVCQFRHFLLTFHMERFIIKMLHME